MDNDMYKMQQDAMNRVREMRKRAKIHFENDEEEKEKSCDEIKEIPKPPVKNKNKSKKRFNNPLEILNLKNIKLDNDSAIILLILFLVSSEDTDEVLILALVYLLM
jgi:hypothetical protein